ncbi:hypothetical protein GTO91_01155 [Heliobacterium undosum]|uniref:Uncharacterized protein n=1 Tax=Heliomicrobium undosum TaxID=121734 RepID=A0A845L0B3_9FIRM|nr:hypothetical protein [Heliomicrobium undosum]MZP28329.1 hypothetical protein [Heliomicrobium undosum]
MDRSDAPQLELLWVFARFLGLYIIFFFLGIFTTGLLIMTGLRFFGYLSVLTYMIAVGRGILLWTRSAQRTLLIWGFFMLFILAKWGYCLLFRAAHSSTFLELTPAIIMFTYEQPIAFNLHVAAAIDAATFSVAVAIAYFGQRRIKTLLNYPATNRSDVLNEGGIE